MVKPSDRIVSRYAQEALFVLGQRIRAARISRPLTMEDVATRAGISRALLRRIENGDPGSAIGAVFEAAAVVGVALFEPERGRLASLAQDTAERIALLPRTARPREKAVKDDF